LKHLEAEFIARLVVRRNEAERRDADVRDDLGIDPFEQIIEVER
jgi:hypothetical protein